MPMEKQNKLVDLSVDFAVQILNLVKFLKSHHETIISNQIGRAGTSNLKIMQISLNPAVNTA